MRIGRILFLAIFVFSVAAIVGVSSFFEGLAKQSMARLNIFDEQGLFQITSPHDAYKDKVVALLKQYGQKQISLIELEQDLFALKVPAAYRDLHLALASAVNDLNQPAPQMEAAKNRLRQLRDSYSWLTSGLTVFLANIF